MPPLAKKELYVSTNQAKLFCQIFGEKHSPLIVVHGGPGLGQNYLLPQMNQLGEFSQAIFYDQRGTGASKEENQHWRTNPFQTYVEDINQLREALNLDTVSMLAHSWGSILISYYALAYPKHVDKLIYLNPVPVSSHDYLAFVKHRTQLVDENKQQLDNIKASKAFISGDPETVEKYYRIYFKNYFTNPDLAQQLSLTLTQEAAIHNFQIYDFFYRYVTEHPFDLYPKLNQLDKPSLIVASDNDVIPLHYVKRLQKSIPNAKLAILENSSHFPYIDQPKILFNLIKTFLK